ncbi:MAG: tRNA preQ1(34) S-adenosylmethionine ribosyltransferase-isomerase QueA [Acidimicrobiales bacterium]|nr:tRNA preQ1(34) S-adenosylmethionine ribosyltransferase-isomerase QueA [Acidimicrobiales bacterium]
MSNYDYALPPEAIAQVPAEPRDSARLLDARQLKEPSDRTVSDLPELLKKGDVLVVNNTKVRQARLQLRKETGGAAEVLLLAPTGDPAIWTALVKPGRRLPPGTVLLADQTPVVEIGAANGTGQRQVRILNDTLVSSIGVLPLPPYIRQRPRDPNRYQTVYADRVGSVAAPTAGLHLTHEVLDQLTRRGVHVETIDLEVGLGTFAPVTAATLDEHVMHTESYSVQPETWDRIKRAPRVVAVGTTVVRTVETIAQTGALAGETDIFIRPGFRWAVVDLLLTNFHMPRSTLLVLVEAFVGPGWHQLYADAIRRGYRVGSFGDAMLLERAESAESDPLA